MVRCGGGGEGGGSMRACAYREEGTGGRGAGASVRVGVEGRGDGVSAEERGDEHALLRSYLEAVCERMPVRTSAISQSLLPAQTSVERRLPPFLNIHAASGVSSV